MATNANEILDRLAALLDAATPGQLMVERYDHCEYWLVLCGSKRVFDDGSAGGEYSPACSPANRDALVAFWNAAPALIRLARASIALDGMDPDSHRHARGCVEEYVRSAIQALGEARL